MATRDRNARMGSLDHEHLWHPSTPPARWRRAPPLIVESAEGCTLTDIAGATYIDGAASDGSNVHGHRHPRLDRALIDQLSRVAHTPLHAASHPPAIELAHRLVSLAPWGLKHVFYSDTGSTATATALEMSRRFQARSGHTTRVRFAVLSDADDDALLLPTPATHTAEEQAACLAKARQHLSSQADHLAALVFEPLVQGSCGRRMHTAGFLRPLLETAREHGILLIADETATGLARTGTLFAMDQIGVTPDFLCLANGLAAGYLPLAATLTTERVHEAFASDPVAFAGDTFVGNPLACAVALASLDLFEENDLLETIVESGRHLRALLNAWPGRPGVAAIRQTGLTVAVDLTRRDGSPWPTSDHGYRVEMRARKLGAVLRSHGNTLVLTPPLSIQPAELTALTRITAEAIQAELD